MAVNEGDYYWEDIFKSTKATADDILGDLDKQSGSWNLFVHPLMETQRLRTAFNLKHLSLWNDLKCFVEGNVPTQDGVNITFSYALLALWSAARHTRAGKSDAPDVETQSVHDFSQPAEQKAGTQPFLDRIMSLVRIDEGKCTELATPLGTCTDILPAYDPVTPPPFTLEEVPQEELARRLGAGEIAPRDEWIPTLAGGEKKKIDNPEVSARLDFAIDLKEKGVKAFRENNVDRACVLFHQAIEALVYYKAKDQRADVEIEQTLRNLRRNKAIVDIKLGNFRDAIKGCTDGLADDGHDGRLRFLRAKAWQALGELQFAKKDLIDLSEDGFADEADRRCAAHQLKSVILDQKRAERGMKSLFAASVESNVFSRGDESEPNATPTDDTLARHPRTTLGKHPVNVAAPEIDGDTLVGLMKKVLMIYTSVDNQKLLERARIRGEFDKAKVIRELRKVLPDIVGPVLMESAAFNPNLVFEERRRAFDRAIHAHYLGEWMSDKTEFLALRAALRTALFQELEAED